MNRIIGLLLVAVVLCSCKSTQEATETYSRSWVTDAALSHFREIKPSLAEHLTDLSNPKPVTGPEGSARLVSLFDKRSGNPSYMLPEQIATSSHNLIVSGHKLSPVVISNKQEIDKYKEIPEHEH